MHKRRREREDPQDSYENIVLNPKPRQPFPTLSDATLDVLFGGKAPEPTYHFDSRGNRIVSYSQ